MRWRQLRATFLDCSACKHCAYNVMQDRITRARLGGDPPDIMITPRLGRVGLFDFHCAEETIGIGAEAAKRSMQTIHEAIEAGVRR